MTLLMLGRHPDIFAAGAARLTIFEGGHGGNFPAGFDFLSRQVKARAVDWTIPSVGEVRGEQLEK